jgi:hypothetical protein
MDFTLSLHGLSPQMKRVSLGSIDQDDHIAAIMAHPMAGKYIASLIEDGGQCGVLASYTAVFAGETVCLRVPVHVATQGDKSHLSIWHGDHKAPWRDESKVLPRDDAQLRLLALAVSTVSPARPRLPSSRAA